MRREHLYQPQTEKLIDWCKNMFKLCWGIKINRLSLLTSPHLCCCHRPSVYWQPPADEKDGCFISAGSLSGIIEPLSHDPLLASHVNICHSLPAEVHRFPSFGKQTYYYHLFSPPQWGECFMVCYVCKSIWAHPYVLLLYNCEKWPHMKEILHF